LRLLPCLRRLRRLCGATLYFSHDGIRRKINDVTGHSPLASSMLPERFRGLPVDHEVQSDWINQ
jgi:hypothetical protein